MIYFIYDPIHRAIKIGLSENISRRLRALRSGNLTSLELLGHIEGDRKTELKLHAKFAGLHVNGEWFRDDPSLRAFIVERCAKDTGEIQCNDAPDKEGFWSFAQALKLWGLEPTDLLSTIAYQGIPHCRYGPLLYFPIKPTLEWMERSKEEYASMNHARIDSLATAKTKGTE